VKLEVWKRDQGQCVICGATDNLHFDHVIPFSKGGASGTVDNIQLLCARHNLEKSDQII
jgi:5-methylcytosine-specific restriction endonuclease McrA